jgi:predicted DNA-binding protein
MTMTTIKLPAEVRDQLVALAANDYGRSTLAETVRRLIEEHEQRAALDAYDRLREDERAWASYRDESSVTDSVAADWMRQHTSP